MMMAIDGARIGRLRRGFLLGNRRVPATRPRPLPRQVPSETSAAKDET